MRKGFTRKPQADEPATQSKNYITPRGLQRLKDEHRFLVTRERPAVTEVVAWAASNGDRSENADYQYGKRRLRQIDGRIRFLTKQIESAEVIDPQTPRAGQAATRAFFGATVRYANAAGTERVVSIVGTDEVDLNRNHISWVSPLGRALIKSTAGDRVVLQAPSGTEYLIVLEVCYERISVEPFREPPGAESSGKGLPRQIHLTKVNEAAHEHARPRVRTNCEPTLRLFVSPLFDVSQDCSPKTWRSRRYRRGSRKVISALASIARLIAFPRRPTIYSILSI